MIALLQAITDPCVTCGARMVRKSTGRHRLYCDTCRKQRDAQRAAARKARRK